MPKNKVRIQGVYRPIIRKIKEFFVKYDNKNIHSVYLRGSVLFGCGIPNISDIDFFVITYSPISDFDTTMIKGHMDRLNKLYSYITRIDFSYYTLNEILARKEQVLIKLTSICVYGNDISSQLKNPKPGKDLTISLSLLSSEIEKTKKEIKIGLYNSINTKPMCVWIMKRIVRSGFELVSLQEKCFTRDLSLCLSMFTKYYPEKEKQMAKALHLALNPTNNTDIIKETFNTIGSWLITKAKEQKLIS